MSDSALSHKDQGWKPVEKANIADVKLHWLHTELADLYRNDPRATARIARLWFQIDMLEDAKRVRARG